MRYLAFVVAVVFCFGSPAAGATGSGVYGKVTRGPIAPICIAEKPCSAPAAGVTLQFVRSGAVAARAVTAKDGSYRVGLRAGTYSVRAWSAAHIRRKISPSAVQVSAGRWSRSNLSIDTGIR